MPGSPPARGFELMDWGEQDDFVSMHTGQLQEEQCAESDSLSDDDWSVVSSPSPSPDYAVVPSCGGASVGTSDNSCAPDLPTNITNNPSTNIVSIDDTDLLHGDWVVPTLVDDDLGSSVSIYEDGSPIIQKHDEGSLIVSGVWADDYAVILQVAVSPTDRSIVDTTVDLQEDKFDGFDDIVDPENDGSDLDTAAVLYIDTLDTSVAVDTSDAVDSSEAVDTSDAIDTSDAVDTNDAIDTSDAVDTNDAIDTSDAVDTSDAIDTSDAVDTSDAANTSDAVNTSNAVDTSDAVDNEEDVPYYCTCCGPYEEHALEELNFSSYLEEDLLYDYNPTRIKGRLPRKYDRYGSRLRKKIKLYVGKKYWRSNYHYY